LPNSELTDVDLALVAAAKQAREHAWVPMTSYRVGAAVLTASGDIIAGCNVEHPVPHEGCCAEKVALYTAVAAGHRHFTAVAVVTEDEPPATPCGSCRQTLDHWHIERVLIAHVDGRVRLSSLKTLLPESFEWEPGKFP
jgi:cytidine deaminase